MTEEIDIWRTAHLLVKRHGDDAAVVAAQRADERSVEGDLDGQHIWKRILAVVVELLRKPVAVASGATDACSGGRRLEAWLYASGRAEV